MTAAPRFRGGGLKMAVREILLLGNPALYEVCDPIEPGECADLAPLVQDLHDTLMDFRSRRGAGRAIAAPQVGVKKRLIYLHIERPLVIVNPRIDRRSREKMTVWDDCMSFPDLLVQVKRSRRCRITFHDLEQKECCLLLEGGLSELLQHECDHLDGILAVRQAVGPRSFALASQKHRLKPDPAAD